MYIYILKERERGKGTAGRKREERNFQCDEMRSNRLQSHYCVSIDFVRAFPMPRGVIARSTVQ